MSFIFSLVHVIVLIIISVRRAYNINIARGGRGRERNDCDCSGVAIGGPSVKKVPPESNVKRGCRTINKRRGKGKVKRR